ncbi:MAG: translation elongation factor-like protein [Patescibacteria group bacterium]
MGLFSFLFGSKKNSASKEMRMPPSTRKIGDVTHYYGGLSVAIVKFKEPARVGDSVKFFGATTDFSEKIGSMQYDHKDIAEAKKGQEVGIKVVGKVREGDEVYVG